MAINMQPDLAAPIGAGPNFTNEAGDTVPTYVVSMDELTRSDDIDSKDLEIATAAYKEVMQYPEAERDALWAFYLQEILPIYHTRGEKAAAEEEKPEDKKAREEREARNRHIGNVAWWGYTDDVRYHTQATLGDRGDASDARYEVRKARAFAAGATEESWNEAFRSRNG